MVILLSFPPSAVLIVAYSDYTGNDVAIVSSFPCCFPFWRYVVKDPFGTLLDRSLASFPLVPVLACMTGEHGLSVL